MKVPSLEERKELQKKANYIAQNLERLGFGIDNALVDVKDPKNPVTLNPSPFVIGIHNPSQPFSDGRYVATLYLRRMPSMVGTRDYGDWAFEVEDAGKLEQFEEMAEKFGKRYGCVVDTYLIPRISEDAEVLTAAT